MLEYASVNRSFIFYVKNEKIWLLSGVPIEDKGNWAFLCVAELFPSLFVLLSSCWEKLYRGSSTDSYSRCGIINQCKSKKKYLLMLVSGISTKMLCVATESIPSWTNRVGGSWVPLALHSAQVIAAEVELCSEQGDSGSKSSEQGGSGSMIQLLEILVLGMPQARNCRIFDRSWLGLFSLFQNAQNVERWDISRPVLEKKGSMFTLFRIAFQLIPIQMLRNIWSFLKIHQSPAGWRGGLQGGGAEYLVVCPILKKQSWSLLCSWLTVHRGNTHHVGEGALSPPSLGYLQPCPPTAPRGNHTWWWTKLVQDRTERIYLGNWHWTKTNWLS